MRSMRRRRGPPSVPRSSSATHSGRTCGRRQDILTAMVRQAILTGGDRGESGRSTVGERGPAGRAAWGGVTAGARGGGRGAAGAARTRARLELAADRGLARRLQAGRAPEVRDGRAPTATEAAMRLLQRSGRRPRAKTIRPAERYLIAGAEEARRLGHNYVGTEHVLSLLTRDPHGSATRLLVELGVSAKAVERALACWLQDASPTATIDPHALAALGVDFEAVRERLEQTFGPGALERTRSACLGICPRLKL